MNEINSSNRYSGFWKKEYFYVDEDKKIKSVKLNRLTQIFRKYFGVKEETQLSQLIRCLNYKGSLTENEQKVLEFAINKFKNKYSEEDFKELIAPTGISNYRNFCYAISTFQAFLASPVILSLIKSPKKIPPIIKSETESDANFQSRLEERQKEEIVREELQNLIEDLSDPQKSTYELGKLIQEFIHKICEIKINKNFTLEYFSEQQDAIELCNILLSSIGYSFNLTTTHFGINKKKNSPIPYGQEFKTLQTVLEQIFTLNFNENTSESFYSLLESSMESVNNEIWEVEYENSKAILTEYTTKMFISSAEPPDVICFQIKKNATRDESGIEKQKKLNLESPYIDLKNLVTSKSKSENESESESIVYRLVSCIDHTGESNYAGHYTSHIFKEGFWFSCDDRSVTRCNFEDVINKNNYLLIFERIKDEQRYETPNPGYSK